MRVWRSSPCSSIAPSRSGCLRSPAPWPTSSCAGRSRGGGRRSPGRRPCGRNIRRGALYFVKRMENVIIIGSGPAGYTAALYTSRANLQPLVIEGFLWGGLLQQTTDVENYPGFRDGIMGPELMQTMRDQAERFGARFITDNATRLEPGESEGDPHTVWIGDERHQARAVVLAMGAEHKKLGVPGEDELANGRGVSYCATCD